MSDMGGKSRVSRFGAPVGLVLALLVAVPVLGAESGDPEDQVSEAPKGLPDFLRNAGCDGTTPIEATSPLWALPMPDGPKTVEDAVVYYFHESERPYSAEQIHAAVAEAAVSNDPNRVALPGLSVKVGDFDGTFLVVETVAC